MKNQNILFETIESTNISQDRIVVQTVMSGVTDWYCISLGANWVISAQKIILIKSTWVDIPDEV